MDAHMQNEIFQAQARRDHYIKALKDYYQEADTIHPDVLEDLGDVFYLIRQDQEFIKSASGG